MREHYSAELANIESEFDRERSEILTRNTEEVQKLFEDHKNTEEEFLIQRQSQEQANAKDLEDSMRTDANKQAEQKIKLETEM